MKNFFYCCLTLVICVYMLCVTIIKSNEGVLLTDGEEEALEYIEEKASSMGISVGEYIQAVKEYEAEQIAIREYWEKVENGTNTRSDDRRAELNGWLE